MKKLLALVLTLCVALGVGVCAFAGGEASPTNEEEARSFGLYNAYSLLPSGSRRNEFISALLPGKTFEEFYNEYRAALDAAYPNEDYWVIKIVDWEDFAACDAVLAKYFNAQLMKDIKVYVKAYVDYSIAWFVLWGYFRKDDNALLNQYESEYYAAIGRYENMPSGTLLKDAARYQFLADEANALIKKMAPPSILSIIWNFILRYILFGWIWMR